MNVMDSFSNMFGQIEGVIFQIVDFAKIEEHEDYFHDTDIVFSLIGPNKTLVSNAKTYEELVCDFVEWWI